MSTILKALEKHRRERQSEFDAEAILERNAALREVIRRRAPDGAPRWVLALMGLTFLLVVLCAIATAWMWMKSHSRDRESPPSSEAAGLAVAPTATPTPATIQLPEPTPVLQETVRLRTHPLLRSAPADLAPAYAAGPQSPQSASPPPAVAAPQPIWIVPSPVLFGQTSASLSGLFGKGSPTSATAAGQSSRDPNDFLRLNGIILDPKRPTALVNDQILQVGDAIEGVKVLAIDNPSYVRVEYQGKEYRLEIK